MSIVRDGVIYGMLCFATGFLLGMLRELALIPMFGPDLGRGIEFPIVTLAAIAIAWWRVERTAEPRTIGSWLAVGLTGVCVLLAFESALALLVFQMPIKTYLDGFDVRQGALLPIGLAIMLAAPAALAMAKRRPTGR